MVMLTIKYLLNIPRQVMQHVLYAGEDFMPLHSTINLGVLGLQMNYFVTLRVNQSCCVFCFDVLVT